MLRRVAGSQRDLSRKATDRERDREPTREQELAAASALSSSPVTEADNWRHGKSAFGAINRKT
jgi:hypothetical protein